MTGTWGEGGVSLTTPQFNFALETKNWWLFVVEGINNGNTEVHQFDNPVRLVNRFIFDSSWKQLVNSASSLEKSLPCIGDKIKLPHGDSEYQVLSISHRGEISVFELVNEFGKKVKKPYNNNWELI